MFQVNTRTQRYYLFIYRYAQQIAPSRSASVRSFHDSCRLMKSILEDGLRLRRHYRSGLHVHMSLAQPLDFEVIRNIVVQMNYFIVDSNSNINARKGACG